MNKTLIALAGLIITLAAACGDATTVPTATQVPRAPTVTATPLPFTPTPVTPTPIVSQEWKLEGIAVDGNTVTVSLHVSAGIDVDVTVGGVAPSRVDAAIPILEFVFENVAGGEQPVVISDVLGFSQWTTVRVDARVPGTEDLPVWLAEWVADLEAGSEEFPPQSITRYDSNGETVYYVLPRCCDQFSDLLDADGNLIGHPDGGITGGGDGVTKFSPSDLEGEVIWLGR
ncbi:MAG: hypothetical protein O2913_09970 [Chloroflexi bacterium]|nr:hypothetical protein [Chloroflexota bacterium]